MAIAKTCKISVYVPSRQIAPLLEFLQRTEAMQLIEKKEQSGVRIISKIEKDLVKLDAAIGVLEGIESEKRSLWALKKSAVKDGFSRQEMKKTERCADEILRLDAQSLRYRERVSETETKLKSLSPFFGISAPLGKIRTKYCESAVFSCRAKSAEDVGKAVQKIGSKIYFDIEKITGKTAYVHCIWLKNQNTEKALKEHGFVRLEGSNLYAPDEEAGLLEEQKAELLKKIEDIQKKQREFLKNRKDLKVCYDRLLIKKDKYTALGNIENTEKVFVIKGYVLKKSKAKLIGEMAERFGAVAELEKPEKNEKLPVTLENGAFAAPVEEITKSYALPGEYDIDPSGIMAVFYYWFFGMMFSDAGYGLLMMIACGALGFLNVLEKEKRRRFQMFFWCGVSTALWGIAYGSFFGDLIGVVSVTFGKGNAEFLPILIDPVNQALELLIISAAFGLVHILTALSIKFYVTWKNGAKWDAVFDVGFWITLLLGAAVLSAGVALRNNGIQNIGTAAMILSAAGLVVTGGRKQKKPIMKILGGFISLYDITSYVGDVLSYSRLMALGLATGVIASVVNVLASLTGGGAVGAVAFTIIALVGHSMNFAINMLGAYVHTNRLQYVEFYQKFYEGGGRHFEPFRIKTKYYEVN